MHWLPKLAPETVLTACHHQDSVWLHPQISTCLRVAVSYKLGFWVSFVLQIDNKIVWYSWICLKWTSQSVHCDKQCCLTLSCQRRIWHFCVNAAPPWQSWMTRSVFNLCLQYRTEARVWIQCSMHQGPEVMQYSNRAQTTSTQPDMMEAAQCLCFISIPGYCRHKAIAQDASRSDCPISEHQWKTTLESDHSWQLTSRNCCTSWHGIPCSFA